MDVTNNNRSNATATTDTDLRLEGSTDRQPLQFPRRSRAEIDAFHRAVATGADMEIVGTAGAQTPRPKPKPRPSSSIGVLVPGISLPKELSGYRAQDVGLLTHAVLAIVTPCLRTIEPTDLVEHVLDVAGGLVNGTNHNRRRSLQQTATAYACRYLRRFAPAEPWQLIGAEFQTGEGRTDLAWQHGETGDVFFDEIKTHSRSIDRIGDEVIDQALRQAAGGFACFGAKFRGVRVLPFGALHHATLVRSATDRMGLAPTPDAPLNPRPNGAAVDFFNITDGLRDRALAAQINAGKVAARRPYKPKPHLVLA